jgi:hypothetical protein
MGFLLNTGLKRKGINIMDKTEMANIVDSSVNFFLSNQKIISVALPILTGLLGGWINHIIEKIKKEENIEVEKFNSVILPCMLIIEPVLFLDITSEKLREIKRICRQNPNLVSIQVFHWIDYKLDKLEKNIGNDKLANESFKSLCIYFSNEYDRLCKTYHLRKRGLNYRQHFNQYWSKVTQVIDFISFWGITILVSYVVIMLYILLVAITF